MTQKIKKPNFGLPQEPDSDGCQNHNSARKGEFLDTAADKRNIPNVTFRTATFGTRPKKHSKTLRYRSRLNCPGVLPVTRLKYCPMNEGLGKLSS